MATETDEFLAEVLPAQRAAEQAIHNGDVEPRLALWSHRDPVTVFGAKLSGSGWTDVEPMFREVASWFSDSQEYEFEVIAAAVSGDLAYTVGYERNEVQVEGKPRGTRNPLTNRSIGPECVTDGGLPRRGKVLATGDGLARIQSAHGGWLVF